MFRKTVVWAIVLIGQGSRAFATPSLSLMITPDPKFSSIHTVPYLDVTLTNVSGHDIQIATGHAGWKDFRFTVHRFDGTLMSKTPAGQIITGDPHSPEVDRMFGTVAIYSQYHLKRLSPGQSFVEGADLPNLYDLPPGSYNVYAETTNLQTRGRLTVTSNVVRFAIQ